MSQISINGKVSRQDLEGGFWGIVSDDGDRYVPVEPLDAQFRKDGLRIAATLEPVSVIGTTMWGKHVRIVDITPE